MLPLLSKYYQFAGMKLTLIGLLLTTNLLFASGRDGKSGSKSNYESGIALFINDEMQDKMLSKLNDHFTYLEKHSDDENERFLKRVFYKTQSTFLHEYEQYAPFSALATSNKEYDCVTGTALYAIILEHFNFEYSIIELDFHAYILVHLSNSDILIESTNPTSGFVTESDEIAKLKSKYRLESTEIKANNYVVDEVERKITVKELAGLHFYNQAVNVFNQGEYILAKRLLKAARNLYDCPRINGLLEITDLSIAKSLSMR
jgi:hypothetical protein